MRSSKFKSGLKSFLTYSKSEKNGTIVLAVILLMLIVGSFIYRPVVSSNASDQETYNKVDSFFSSIKYVELDKGETQHDILAEELPLPKVDNFYFNPNTISVDSLVDLGLSPKQAQVVINYRNKGGRFRTADDFSKIHVIDSATFHRLKPLIRIPENPFVKIDSSKVAEIPLLIELNSADSVSLTRLKGIGRSFARRIVAYRDLLGGFYSINQLNEVYGLTPETINSIRSNIWVDSTSIRMLNLNQISYEELKQHPYLTDYQAKSIIYYRSKQQVISKPIDLLNNKIIPPDRYQKIAPYFDVK